MKKIVDSHGKIHEDTVFNMVDHSLYKMDFLKNDNQGAKVKNSGVIVLSLLVFSIGLTSGCSTLSGSTLSAHPDGLKRGMIVDGKIVSVVGNMALVMSGGRTFIGTIESERGEVVGEIQTVESSDGKFMPVHGYLVPADTTAPGMIRTQSLLNRYAWIYASTFFRGAEGKRILVITGKKELVNLSDPTSVRVLIVGKQG